MFYIRDMIRNKTGNLKKIGLKDIIADFVSFIIIAIFFHLFYKLTGIFAKYKGWRYERHKNISDLVKKMVTFFVGFFTLLHIYTYFTLYTNNLKKIFLFSEYLTTLFSGAQEVLSMGDVLLHTHLVLWKPTLRVLKRLHMPDAERRRPELIFYLFFVLFSFYVYF